MCRSTPAPNLQLNTLKEMFPLDCHTLAQLLSERTSDASPGRERDGRKVPFSTSAQSLDDPALPSLGEWFLPPLIIRSRLLPTPQQELVGWDERFPVCFRKSGIVHNNHQWNHSHFEFPPLCQIQQNAATSLMSESWNDKWFRLEGP